MIRLPFRDAEHKTTAPLEIVHSDLCGPMKHKSIGGSSYFMLLIDDYTKFTAVYFLKKKSEAAECFKNYKAHVEKVHSEKGSNYVIKAVRTDGGGEFTGTTFLRELDKSGIEAHTTVPYTPQEDGISENGNRVLVGRANSLLKQAGAPSSYWAEAIQTAVYLKNISITKGTHGLEATPFELWFGKKPKVEHLRVWGCTAYAYIHPANRSDKKWSARAEKMMFVGYTMTTKQYRLYNPKTRTFVKSRDVVFYEDTPFFQQTAEQVFMPLTKEEEKVHPVTIKSQSNGPVTRSRAKVESEGGGEAGSGSGS